MECIGYALSVQPQTVIIDKLETAIGPYIQLLAQTIAVVVVYSYKRASSQAVH